MITLSQFVSKWTGQKCDFDGQYGGQCVDLFRMYLKEVLGASQPKGVIGAADFWTNSSADPNLNSRFIKVPNTPTGVPQMGDIMIWRRLVANGNKGHISIVTMADVNKFVSFDQNWRQLSVSELTLHDYRNVYGWLHPK